MILEPLWAIWCFLVNTVLDGVVYLIADYFVKSAIKNASSDEEKGIIWLGECALLFLLSVFFYVTSHTPFLLIIMIALTLGFTQIQGQVNIVFWWSKLLSRWDEFKQHEESMEEFERRTRSSSPPMIPGPAPLRNIPLSTDPPDYQRYPIQVSARKPIRPDAVGYPNMEALRPGMQYRQQQHALLLSHARQKPAPRQEERSPPPKITFHQTSGITSKICSVLGIGGQKIPPGLKNSGQNLCFFNSIMQCICHSPGLATAVIKAEERPECSMAESCLVRTTKDLIKQMMQPTDYRLFNTVDTSSFRAAANVLLPTMIASPQSTLQRQQDAAELLMWLLDTLHIAMNQAPARKKTSVIEITSTNSTLSSQLRSLYGELTMHNVQEMRSKYLREIEMANSMDPSAHSESIRRAADLDWLLHKHEHSSVWDDMFSGQLIECQHCLTCSRHSVGLQVFTVLTVPIVDPREVSGFVYLEDCFSKLVSTENLFGREGLCCPCSNPTRRSGAKTPLRPRSALTSTDSAMNSPNITNQSTLFMSPIPNIDTTSLNDSGFPDHYRTSTPINDRPILTNGQRRALLRHLPKFLIIQLMRFRFNSQHHDQYKIHTPVHIPVRNLSLSSMMLDDIPQKQSDSLDSKCMYDLYAMCLHLGTGSTNFGHYIAYCCTDTGVWWQLDDEKVTQVNMDFELNSRLVRENAYVLFYKRRDE